MRSSPVRTSSRRSNASAIARSVRSFSAPSSTDSGGGIASSAPTAPSVATIASVDSVASVASVDSVASAASIPSAWRCRASRSSSRGSTRASGGSPSRSLNDSSSASYPWHAPIQLVRAASSLWYDWSNAAFDIRLASAMRRERRVECMTRR